MNFYIHIVRKTIDILMNTNNLNLDNNTKTGSTSVEFTACIGLPEPIINTQATSQVVDLSSLPIDKANNTVNSSKAIEEASRNGNIHAVIELLDKHTFDEKTLHNCAYQAIYCNHDDIVGLLLDRSIISIDTKLFGCSTLLHFATNYGRTDTIKMLLKRGPDVHIKDDHDHTAFLLAAMSHKGEFEFNKFKLRKSIMELLLENGANIEDRMPYQNYTALEWWGKWIGDYEMKQWLISKGANQDVLKPRPPVNRIQGWHGHGWTSQG